MKFQIENVTAPCMCVALAVLFTVHCEHMNIQGYTGRNLQLPRYLTVSGKEGNHSLVTGSSLCKDTAVPNVNNYEHAKHSKEAWDADISQSGLCSVFIELKCL